MRDPIDNLILPMLADWLTNSSYWRQYARLYPDAVDDHNGNLTTLFLATLIYRVFIRNPGFMLEYWLRIALVRDWLDHRQYNDNDIDAIAKQLHRYLETKAQESTLQVVSRFAAWDMGYDPKLVGIRLSGVNIPYDRVRNADTAMFELYGQHYSLNHTTTFDRARISEYQKSDGPTESFLKKLSVPQPMRGWHKACLDNQWKYKRTKGTGFEGYFVNTIRGIIKRMDSKSGCVAAIPLQIVVSGQSSSFAVYSFLRLISVIGDLIALLCSANSQDYKSSIGQILGAATWVRNYPMPSTDGKINNINVDNLATPDDVAVDDGETDNSELGSADDSPDLTIMVDALSNWLQYHNALWKNDTYAVAPVILARMWTRFSYTFDSIRDNLRHKQNRYLGVVFHHIAIAFMHSVGVEEAGANGWVLPRSVQNNPVTSGILFLRLLKNLNLPTDQTTGQSDAPGMRFFNLLFSCPIWGFFLARTDIYDAAQDHNDINKEIFEIYYKIVSIFCNGENGNFKDLDRLWTVSVRDPGAPANIAEFQGLHDILNTIYMQGQTVIPVKVRTPKTSASDRQ